MQVLTFSDLLDWIRIARSREQGQTMAEYGVTLAVITVATVAVFTALSAGASRAVQRVIGLIPS
jgi:Flp pilus assembly pilin Flp